MSHTILCPWFHYLTPRPPPLPFSETLLATVHPRLWKEAWLMVQGARFAANPRSFLAQALNPQALNPKAMPTRSKNVPLRPAQAASQLQMWLQATFYDLIETPYFATSKSNVLSLGFEATQGGFRHTVHQHESVNACLRLQGLD